MSLLNDHQIIQRSHDGMITPFISNQVKHHLTENDEKVPVISYGLSSAGYDMRLDCHIKIPADHVGILDPKTLSQQSYNDIWIHEYAIINPGTTILGTSMETFDIPEDIHCLCVGKSTYARIGVHILTTPAEPGWSGKLTLEISNLSGVPVKVYAFEGIAQMMFFRLDARPITTYKDRQGKYNGQTTTTIAKV